MQANKILIELYINLLTIQKKFGLRIQKLLISPNILNCGAIKSVIGDLRGIDPQNELKIGRTSKELSKRPNTNFLILKFKKSQIKIVVPGSL